MKTLQTILLLFVCTITYSQNCISDPDTFDGCEVFLASETIPVFKGGNDSFFAYILKNIAGVDSTPVEIQTKITVTFIVDTTGVIHNACIINSKNTKLESRIIQLIEEMPTWEAAEHLGRKVHFRMIIPIRIDWQ